VGNIFVAKHKLVDFVVIGRPIYKSANPRRSVEKILELINEN
jgi:orotidine-5'-phosphate decarboxylase